MHSGPAFYVISAKAALQSVKQRAVPSAYLNQLGVGGAVAICSSSLLVRGAISSFNNSVIIEFNIILNEAKLCF